MKIERVEQMTECFSDLGYGEVFSVIGGATVYMKLRDFNRAVDLENGYTYSMTPDLKVVVDRNATMKTTLF